jgi:ATP-dependent protease ClpP protease subunit
VEVIQEDCDRDFIMTTGHALEYGIIDKILTHHGTETK